MAVATLRGRHIEPKTVERSALGPPGSLGQGEASPGLPKDIEYMAEVVKDMS